MGALRTIGIAVFVAGIVYFAIGLVFGAGLFYGIFGELPPTTGAAGAIATVLGFGLVFGPLLVVIALAVLYASARMREKAAVSA